MFSYNVAPKLAYLCIFLLKLCNLSKIMRIFAQLDVVLSIKGSLMNKIEKISIARVVSDLIKADSVIDSREMELFGLVKDEYKLNRECLNDTRFMTFSDAVNNLRFMGKAERAELMKLFKDITLADGMCNKDEALLMMALLYCMEGEYEAEMVHVRVPQQGLQLENSQVIYVEAKYDEEINKVIQENYQQIENAMRLAGFDFAYIPQIAKTYKSTPEELFHEVMSFLTPNLDEKELSVVVEKVSNMTTAEFCLEQLCKKLHISCLSETGPALLMKVGETISENNIFANFLKIDIDDNMLDEIKKFMYRFTSMMNAEYSILRNIYNSSDRFVYSGVYKQIMDLCLMKDNLKSIVLLDTFNQKIKFEDINEELKVSKSEKALYVLILAESLSGGANFNPPASPKYMELYKKRLKRLTRKFAKIYHMFGGDEENAPDIFDPKIRRPKISKINKYIDDISSKFTSPEDYMIQRTSDGLYRVRIDNSMIFCSDNDPTPWMQSEKWKTILSI